MLASDTTSFPQMSISDQGYSEMGASIIHSHIVLFHIPLHGLRNVTSLQLNPRSVRPRSVTIMRHPKVSGPPVPPSARPPRAPHTPRILHTVIVALMAIPMSQCYNHDPDLMAASALAQRPSFLPIIRLA
jgi:hypothetical protein